MPKISSYSNAGTPTLSDKLIGTEVGATPTDATKNFTIEQLQSLITAGSVYYSKLLTPAVVETLFSAPDTVIAAPGVGKAIWVQKVVWSVDPGGAGPWAFAGGTLGFVRYAGSADKITINLQTAELNSVSQKTFNLTLLLLTDDNELLENTAVEIATDNDAPAQAGDMYVGVEYKIINVPSLEKY